jgi:DNA-binding transcriptional LysR family regulator
MTEVNIDWNQLKSFEAVARIGSLAAVSRKTGATQPTLSRHVRELEEKLGVQLFDRTANGLILTPTGTELFAHAQDMQRSASLMSLVANGQSEHLAGTVRITASQVVARYLLPPILADLLKQEPEIEIELVSSDQTDNLLEREADIAVRMYKPEQLDVIAKRLGELESGAYASHEYLRLHGYPDELADFAKHDFVGYDTRMATINDFKREGIKIDRHFFRFRSDDESDCWQMVVNGFGIGFTLVALGNAEPKVERLLPTVATERVPIWLTAHAELRTSRRIRHVYDHLSAQISAKLNEAMPS